MHGQDMGAERAQLPGEQALGEWFLPSWNVLERINVTLLQLSRLLSSQRLGKPVCAEQ